MDLCEKTKACTNSIYMQIPLVKCRYLVLFALMRALNVGQLVYLAALLCHFNNF